MNQCQRITFLNGYELLDKQIRQCQFALGNVTLLNEGKSNPVSEALSRIAYLETQIIGLLKHFQDFGPKEILNRQLQYSGEDAPLSFQADAQSALQQLFAVNHDLDMNLKLINCGTPTSDDREVLDLLSRRVDNYCREISLVYVTLSDL